MKLSFALLALAAFVRLGAAESRAADADASLRSALQSQVTQYLESRTKAEHISAVSLSVNFPGKPETLDITAGRTKFGGAGDPVTPGNLFQIGSNTKSFTAVTLLQLEAAGKLSIEQTVGKWLPQYPAWRKITIHRLLDMTSGIPTYDAEQSMLKAYAADPLKDWTPQELIAFVYPRIKPPPIWLYSNTAYLLSQLIIEKVTDRRYGEELRQRFFSAPSLHLDDTYYETSMYPPSVTSRLVSGYFYSDDPDNAGLAPLLGKDVKSLSISWTQAAGGVVANPEDVTRWARALYEGPLLAAKQRRELMTLVSQETGKPIAHASAEDPHAFGLGVGELYSPGLGRVWFYEGETLGYRMTYAYLPKSRIVYAVGLNSQPPKKQDQVGKLMQGVYEALKSAGKL